jgi:hypothetical protein
MGRKRKSRLTVADIGRLPLVRLPDARPRQTLKEFQATEEARIKAEERQRLEDVSRPLKEAARLASVRIAKYWSQNLEDIKLNGIDFTPNDLAGNYEMGPRDDKAEEAAWNEFNANLTSQGCTIYRGGFQRLQMYLESLAYHRDVSLTSVANWKAALDRLVSLNCFESHELEGYQPLTAMQTAPEPERHAVIDPLAEIERLNLDSRAGNRQAKQLATNDFFGRQMAPIADQWRDWLLATFNYVLTDDARKAAGQWWERNPTASPLTASSWTQMRLNLVKRGIMPPTCRTKEEILMETIEASSERGDSYETRRNLRQQIRDLAQK